MNEKKLISNIEEARYFISRNRVYSDILLVVVVIMLIGLIILGYTSGDQENYRLVFCSTIVVNEFATICYLLTTKSNLYFYDRIINDEIKHKLIHLEFKVTRSDGSRINLFISLICSIIICILELLVPLIINVDIKLIAFSLIYFILMFGNMFFSHNYSCVIPTFLCSVTFITMLTGMILPCIICLGSAIFNLIIELGSRNILNQKLISIYELEQMNEDLKLLSL